MKSSICAVVACALALAGCGDNSARRAVCGDFVCELSETAESCAEDCGCGNGVANPGEDCDGTDLGGATCESAVQRGGTLACNADCTFDVRQCDEYMCGNGIAEPGEECDGSDVAGATCASIGFSAGQVGCTTSCRFDGAACCNNFCDAANTSVCVGDTAQTCMMMSNGCLGLEVTDCSLNDNVCDDSAGTATCTCVDRCQAPGVGRCVATVAQSCAMQANGCLNWETVVDCATTGQDCALGPQGSTCTPAASGEDCFDSYPITAGQNLIGWTATNADYLTAQPSCNTSTLAGPDVVLAYTATVNGIASYSIPKQAEMRHVAVVTNAACGTITAPTEVSCVADTDLTTMGDVFAVTAGTTYYFYIRDTSLGSAPLPSPLQLELTEATCTGLANSATNLSPANGSTVTTSSPIISFDLPYPVKTNVGVITISGDQGTALSYNLAATPFPSAVTFSNGGRTIRIDPPDFKPNETLTVAWSGLVDEICQLSIAPPTWTFTLGTASCSPGVGGMVGRTVTRRATGLSTLTEQYVAVDQDPNGYVYFGGLSDLYRMPKAGGPLQNVVSDAVITSTQLGYAVLIVGARIFSLDALAASTSPFLWRLSTSGGVTWNSLGYGQYPITPGAASRAMFHHKGRLYMVTKETTSGAATEIWSVSATASQLPAAAVREGTLVGEIQCDGIAGDDHYFYLTCENSRIVRVSRTTFQPELITDAIPLDTLKNELHAHDFDGDGRADALYVKSDDETVQYVCGPAAAGPFWHDLLVDFGGPTTTSNYGLGFDPVANALWAFDDDNRELVLIK